MLDTDAYGIGALDGVSVSSMLNDPISNENCAFFEIYESLRADMCVVILSNGIFFYRATTESRVYNRKISHFFLHKYSF